MILFYSLHSTKQRCHRLNNLWQFKYFPVVYSHSPSLGRTISSRALFISFQKSMGWNALEKGNNMLHRARTLFLFSQCHSVKVSDMYQLHTTARLVVSSVSSMETSDYNLNIEASHIQLFRGCAQSLLHIRLIRLKSLDEITWIDANVKMLYSNPF